MKPIIKVEGIIAEMGLHDKAWKPVHWWQVSISKEQKNGLYRSLRLKDFKTKTQAINYAKRLRARS